MALAELVYANVGKILKTFMKIWETFPKGKHWTELIQMVIMSQQIADGLRGPNSA